jgi:hypothetical protein
MPAIVDFLRRHGRKRQFFPVYRTEDFEPGSPTTPGFQPEDFLVARDTAAAGGLLGVMGLWDQSAYKQTVVRGYDPSLGRVRGLANALAWVAGVRRPPLPGAGSTLASAYASFTCVVDDDPRVFAALLAGAYALAAQRGYGYLLIGLPVHDPLIAVARRYPHITYHSRLYLADWDGGRVFGCLDGRLPYVEIAAL